jgi:hypothetical protein
VKFATTALTDANFDTTGTAVTAPTPGAAGSAEAVRVRPLRAGTAYWVAVASVDDAGNRSAAQVAGPLTPRFDQAAVVGAPNTVGDAGFGLAMVRGKFNDDDFEDVAISAPFVTAGGVAGAGEVYVYFGSATGLATTPGVTIRGVTADAAFGSALTAVRWSSTTRSDLVVSEPFGDGGSGAIYVWNGGAAFPTGAITPASAPRRIGAATTANWFSGSALGWQLAAADHDGDGTDDLITTAVFGNAGAAGAALVFYGGTVPAGTVRISDTSAAGSGTAVVRMYEEVGLNLFGYYLHNVGPTTGVADVADDLAVGYAEDGLAGADVVVLRSTGGRPAAPGVTREPFTVGRDVRVHSNINDTSLEWGSTVSSVTDRNGNGARELVFGDYRYARRRRHRRGGRRRGARHRRRPHHRPVRHGHPHHHRRDRGQRPVRHADREQRQRDHPRRRRRRHRGPAGRGDGRRGGGDERVVWPDPARGAAHDRAQSPDQWSGQLRRGDPGHRRVADHGDLGGGRER